MAYQRPTVRSGALRLHFNENTAGCSPAVIAAIQSITREDVAFYPDYEAVTARAADALEVSADWVQLTNGLDEGLHVVALAAMRSVPGPLAPPAVQVLIAEPAFEMYAACAEAVGAEIVRVLPEFDGDFEFPLARLLAAITPATRVIYLTDPGNPTGLPIPEAAIDTLAGAAPDALVLVDEAYADFSGRTSIGRTLDRHRNLVVGRTFAKAHGLAAMRTGALVAHPATLAPIRRLMPPYSLNICAVRALEAALDDRPYVAWYLDQVVHSRDEIYDFCGRHGLTYWPSEANFVLVRIGEQAGTVTERLADAGILVRDKSRAPGCAGCLRVTAGVLDHTKAALAALEALLAPRED